MKKTIFKCIVALIQVIAVIFTAGLLYAYIHCYNDALNQIDSLEDEVRILNTQIMNLEELNYEYQIMSDNMANDLEINSLKIKAYESEDLLDLPLISNEEIDMMAKTVLGEAGGCSVYEQSMVAWCILNRLDTGNWGNRIAGVVAAPHQFHGYIKTYPIKPEIKNLVIDVIIRWHIEKVCGGDVGRTLPADMINFHANKAGTHNLFYNRDGVYYSDWENKPNPYSE